MREGGRLKKKEREIERERRGSETDVPKLYPTMNMNSLCYDIVPGLVICGEGKSFPEFHFYIFWSLI